MTEPKEYNFMDSSADAQGEHDFDEASWRKGAVRPTHRAINKFLTTKDHGDKVGLCLSGGGYRAALFHLGALRRLNELGILSRVDMISAVSGGSILAAHLAECLHGRWPEPETCIADWDRIEQRFLQFTAKDIRTGALLRFPGRVEALQARYASDLTRLKLSELPERPLIIFGATELVHRRYWTCSRERVGSSSTDYFKPTNWTVARAVAASSCFPPLFPPMDVSKLVPKDHPWKKRARPRRLLLSDGGIYDNTGYLGLWNKCGVVLVSDGGGQTDAAYGETFYWRLKRYQAVQGYSGRGTHKAWLLTNLMSGHQKGAYWGMHTNIEHFGLGPDTLPSYPNKMVNNYIARVRTDLNAFTPGEQQVLMNHGYLLAAAAVQRWVPWLGAPDVPVREPCPDLMEPGKAQKELADSSKRRFLFFQL